MFRVIQLIILLVAVSACSVGNLEPLAERRPLIFVDEARLILAKQAGEANKPTYIAAYNTLIKQADKELGRKIDPVTNKTRLPASGDIHDYHTLGSYYWPDESKADGLPWVYKDGEFNPINLSPATDWSRRKQMLKSLGTLNLAFYHSRDKKYLIKAAAIVHSWFINPKTKMNPNINYGKAIPGKVSGTNFSVIDWTDIGKVITTIQLIERHDLWHKTDQATMNTWLNDYHLWLTTSQFGIKESTRANNHGTNYDYQLIGLQLYLSKISEAEAQLEKTKTLRIEAQIAENGSQPLELKRTKSVNYTVNNLWALARIADLARRHTSVDLWSHRSKNGVSLKAGFDFVVPYIAGEKVWQWRQITGGGAKSQLKKLALPMLSKAELMLGTAILPTRLSNAAALTAEDILTYAPSVTAS